MIYKTPFLMSIEPGSGEKTFVDGFHLGTDLAIARSLAQERFHGRVKAGMPVVTIAILAADRKIVDVYDGQWSSARN